MTSEIVTITNHNNYDVELNITIFEQFNRQVSAIVEQFFEPDGLIRGSNSNTQYLNESGDWINAEKCSTPSNDETVLQWVQQALERNPSNGINRELVNVQVAWHVLFNSSGQGNIEQSMIEDQIEVLNDAYALYDIFFTLSSVDYTQNDNWFNDMSAYENTYKQQLNIDPVHYLNIYSGNMPGLLGWSYLPYQWPENSYMHGVCLLYSSLPGGTAYPYNQGDTATHEVGHYLGLLHTFENGCSVNNDYVADTPQENDGNNIYSCNNTDTCPNDPGMDPVHNFMTYTDDACLTEFTVGQGDRMENMIATYRPGLLENPVSPNWLFTNETTVHVPADSSVMLNVVFDATSIAGGEYSAVIYFNEEAMDTTVMLMTVMRIEGVANLNLSFTSLVDSLYPNEFSNNFLHLNNSGTETLTYEFIEDLSWLTIFGGDGSLTSGETQFVTFNLNSLFMLTGEYQGVVELSTNLGFIHIPVELFIMEVVGIDDESNPGIFTVSNSYPNPFNPSTHVKINIPTSAQISANVYNIKGEWVKTLFAGNMDSGAYELAWDGKNSWGQTVANGIYILQIRSANFDHKQKLIFIK